MLNIVLNIDLDSRNRALHWDFEYSAEYRPGQPNINVELYIRSLNIALNMVQKSHHFPYLFHASK